MTRELIVKESQRSVIVETLLFGKKIRVSVDVAINGNPCDQILYTVFAGVVQAVTDSAMRCKDIDVKRVCVRTIDDDMPCEDAE